MKYLLLIAIIIVLLSSCTRYGWYATESKISTVKDRIVITPIGKSVAIGDTTVKGMVITRKKIK